MDELAIIAQHAVTGPLAGSVGLNVLALATLAGVACLLVMMRCARKRCERGSGVRTVAVLAVVGLAALAFRATPERTAAAQATANAVQKTEIKSELQQKNIIMRSDGDTVVTVEVPDRTSIRAAARLERDRLRDVLRDLRHGRRGYLPAIGAVLALLLIGYAGCRACLGRKINWPVGVLVIVAFAALMAAATALG